MYISETYSYVETVGVDGKPCVLGELGNVIVISFYSWVMLIVWLEFGDVGKIIEELCKCGRWSCCIEYYGRI